MVRRDNIKVLEMKAKALPLLVSMILHMLVMVVFAIVKHEKEKVFHVELIMQDMGYMHKSQIKQSYRTSPRFFQPVVSRDAAYSLSRDEKTEIKTDSVNKTETLPAIESSNADIASAKSTTSLLTGGDKAALPDTKAGGDSATRVIGHGSAVIEAEFGSINGPSFLRMVKPEYPRFARRLGKEGKVVLRLFIDEHGKLLSVEVIEKAGYGFDEAAVDAVRASAFRPARLNGHSVACRAVLPVRFRLE